MNWKRWLYGLVSTVINSIASGVVLLLTGLANDPMSGTVDWQRLGTASIILGLWGAANYLAKSPAPEWNGVERRNGLAKVAPLLLIAALVSGMLACHPPPTIVTPQGKTAYTANEIAKRVGELQGAVIQAEAAGAIPTSVARPIVEFAVSSLKVLKVTPAGWGTTVATAWKELKAKTPAQYLTNPAIAAAWGAVDLALAAFGV